MTLLRHLLYSIYVTLKVEKEKKPTFFFTDFRAEEFSIGQEKKGAFVLPNNIVLYLHCI